MPTPWVKSAAPSALLVDENNAPYWCDDCPCLTGPQTLERVIWERRQAADIEGNWGIGIGYSTGTLVDETFDDVDNERYFYRCTSGHTSAADTEPGIGANWATVWEVATLTLAEAQFYLNGLGPYYLSNNAYAGGGSAPTAHPATYGDSATDLAEALILAADLLKTLYDKNDSELVWNHEFDQVHVGYTNETDYANDLETLEDQVLFLSSSVTKIAVLSKGQHAFSIPYYTYLAARAITFEGLTLERDHAAAFKRDVYFYCYLAKDGTGDPDEHEFAEHGQGSWLWSQNEWGLFDSKLNVDPSTQDVIADDPAVGDLSLFPQWGDRPSAPYGDPIIDTASMALTEPYIIAKWNFNSYPNGGA